MTDQEMRDRVGQMHTTLFGVEGQGGLTREVDELNQRVTECEARLNTFSGKWLALTGFLMLIGQFGAAALARYLFH